MSFRLVPKSVTLNDLERRNGPYFALFHRIFVYDVVAKQLLHLLPRFQNLLLIVRDYKVDFETEVGLIIVLRQHCTRKFGEITQNKGHYAIQGHRFWYQLIESSYASSY